MNEPLVSVVILNYNGLNDLKECFDSLLNLNYKNTELVLVDNNSQDESVEFVRKNYKEVKIFELNKNYGFAKGNNYGVKRAIGDYIVLLNMDTVVDEDWLSELVITAERSEKIGIVGGKIYHYGKKKTIDFAGSFSDKYGNTSNIGQNTLDIEFFNKEERAFYISGASLLFKRELFEKLKLFDSTYFAYYEDVDFCWRVWISGYDVIFTPKAFIYHKIGRVIKSKWRKRYLLERNKLRTLLKNYEFKTLLKILPSYFQSRLIKVLKFSYKARVKAINLTSIYLRAILWNIIHFKSLIKNRKFVQSNRIKDDAFIFQLMEELQGN